MRVMVRPILFGISRLAKTVGTDSLDKDEIESGEIAFSALAYQYGAMLDARVLVALWLAGVTLPRVLQYAESKKRAAKAEQALHGADNVKPEKVVQGTVTSIVKDPAMQTSTGASVL